MLLAIVAVFLTGSICLLNSMTQMRKNVETTTKNYMKDMASLVGREIEMNSSNGLEKGELKKFASGVGIEGMSSSYLCSCGRRNDVVSSDSRKDWTTS